MPDLFLSYSRDDSLTMGVIRDNLRKLGFNVWVDIEHLKPGTPQWVRAVRKAIRSTDGIIVLCSPSAEQSEWVGREIHEAKAIIRSGHGRMKFVIPVLVRGDETNAIPFELVGDQYLDMRGRSMPEYGLRELVTWLAEWFDADMPDYDLYASDSMQIPTVQIINIHEYHEGHVVNIGGDVSGEVNVAGRDIHYHAPPPPVAVQPERDEPKPRTRPAWLNEPRAIIIGAVITGTLALLGTLIGIVGTGIATGGFVLGGGGTQQTPITGTPTTHLADNDGESPTTPETNLPSLPPTVLSTPVPAYAQGQIIFASNRSGNFNLYLMDMLTRQVTQLTQDVSDNRWPSWSPDGNQIVFVSDRAGNDDLYVMDGSGQNVVQLTKSESSDRYPAWAPDGTYIAFVRENVNGDSLLLLEVTCLSDPNGCEYHLTPVTVNRYDLHPAWAPDSNRIAFAASEFPGLPWVVSLFELDSDTHTPLPGTGSSDHLPAWSPDGSRIGFSSSAEDAPDLWVMSDDGEVECQLTFNSANDVEIAWSPDGRYMVFASDRGEEGDFELYLIRADCDAPEGVPETDLIQLTDNDADDFDPEWFP